MNLDYFSIVYISIIRVCFSSFTRYEYQTTGSLGIILLEIPFHYAQIRLQPRGAKSPGKGGVVHRLQMLHVHVLLVAPLCTGNMTSRLQLPLGVPFLLLSAISANYFSFSFSILGCAPFQNLSWQSHHIHHAGGSRYAHG